MDELLAPLFSVNTVFIITLSPLSHKAALLNLHFSARSIVPYSFSLNALCSAYLDINRLMHGRMERWTAGHELSEFRSRLSRDCFLRACFKKMVYHKEFYYLFIYPILICFYPSLARS